MRCAAEASGLVRSSMRPGHMTHCSCQSACCWQPGSLQPGKPCVAAILPTCTMHSLHTAPMPPAGASASASAWCGSRSRSNTCAAGRPWPGVMLPGTACGSCGCRSASRQVSRCGWLSVETVDMWRAADCTGDGRPCDPWVCSCITLTATGSPFHIPAQQVQGAGLELGFTLPSMHAMTGPEG